MYKKYIKKSLQDFKPYECEEYVKDAIRLDMNTPLKPPSCYNNFLKYIDKNRDVNLYFDPSYKNLKKLIAKYEKAKPEQIVVGNSGDEIIDIITKAFLDKNDKFIISSPTYSMFEIQGQINGGIKIDVPLLNNFTIDTSNILKQKAKLLFICNPNNPTGTVSSQKSIEKIIKAFKGIVVVDEAYGEYYGKSYKKLINKYDNLIITKTFSKFGSIAGARVGYLLCNKNLAKLLDGVRLPYGVSYFSYILAEMILSVDTKAIANLIKNTKLERERVKKILKKNRIKFLDSKANFILIKLDGKAKYTIDQLKKNGIIVRDLTSKSRIRNCIRVTIADKKINNKFLTQLIKNV